MEVRAALTRDVGVDSSLLGPFEVLVHGEQRALGSPGGEDGPGVVVAGQLADVSRAARERD